MTSNSIVGKHTRIAFLASVQCEAYTLFAELVDDS